MSKDLRIAFTGTHSTGKTTLCNALSEELDITNVINLTRDVPKDMRGTKEGQELILTNYLYRIPRLDSHYVVDRSILDIIAYSLTANIGWSSSMVGGLMEFYKHSNFYPTHLFYLPIEFELVQDGERPDEKSRITVDSYIQELMGYNLPNMHTITGTVEERLSKINEILRE